MPRGVTFTYTLFVVPTRPPPRSTLFPYTTLFRSCAFGDMATSGPTSSYVIHVTATTHQADCGILHNTVSDDSTNLDAPHPPTSHITLHCPNLTLTKTADPGPFSAGDQVGFTVTVH